MKRYVVTDQIQNDLDNAAIQYAIEGFKLNLAEGILTEPYLQAAEEYQIVLNKFKEKEIPEAATHVCWQDKSSKHWIMKEI